MAMAMMYPEPADTSKDAMKDKTGSVTEPFWIVILGRLRVQKSDDRDYGLLRLRHRRP